MITSKFSCCGNCSVELLLSVRVKVELGPSKVCPLILEGLLVVLDCLEVGALAGRKEVCEFPVDSCDRLDNFEDWRSVTPPSCMSRSADRERRRGKPWSDALGSLTSAVMRGEVTLRRVREFFEFQ